MSSKRRGGEHRPKRYAKRAEKIRLRPRRKTPESRNFAVRNPAPTKPRKVPVKRHGIDEYRSHNRVRKPSAAQLRPLLPPPTPTRRTGAFRARTQAQATQGQPFRTPALPTDAPRTRKRRGRARAAQRTAESAALRRPPQERRKARRRQSPHEARLSRKRASCRCP